MSLKHSLRTPNSYNDKFQKLIQGRKQILKTPLNKREPRKVYKLQPGEVFKQCCLGIVDIPPWYFVSDNGTLLSINNNKLQWHPSNSKPNNDRDFYDFRCVTPEGHEYTKTIPVAGLVDQVFKVAPRFGLADQIVAEQGAFAFKRVNEAGKVQGHHMDGKKNNRADEVQTLSTESHVALTKAPRPDSSPQRLAEWIEKYFSRAAAEEPNRIPMALTGWRPDKDKGWIRDTTKAMVAYDSIKITRDALKSIWYMIGLINGALAEKGYVLVVHQGHWAIAKI